MSTLVAPGSGAALTDPLPEQLHELNLRLTPPPQSDDQNIWAFYMRNISVPFRT